MAIGIKISFECSVSMLVKTVLTSVILFLLQESWCAHVSYSLSHLKELLQIRKYFSFKGGQSQFASGSQFSQSSSSFGQQRGQGQLATQGQGQLVTQGQGQLVSQGQGQLVTQGQGQFAQGGRGQFSVGGLGQTEIQESVSFFTGVYFISENENNSNQKQNEWEISMYYNSHKHHVLSLQILLFQSQKTPP